VASLAPAIGRLAPLTRQSLLALLALPDAALCRAVGVTDIPRTLRRARVAGAARVAPTALCRHEPGYPLALAQLPSSPAVLHATSPSERLLEMLAAPTVVLLGERRHTHYAHQVTFALARDLALAGVTVISGLHQGIDAIAHHGALHAGGRTIAVTGCAPEIPYPRQLDHLHRQIASRGAVLSEFPPSFSPPLSWCLLASQRILAALASVVVIVEASARSSTLLAAQVAAELGCDLAVVPGRVTDAGGAGTLGLLRDGAHPVGSARDVLDLIYGAGVRGVAAH
jgi:DNA processing protein